MATPETNTLHSLSFKWGTVQNKNFLTNTINYPLSAGTIYVAKDERSMYVDTDEGRIRLGDFVEYNTLDDLKNDYESWNTFTLAYIKEGNILAKYDDTIDQSGNVIGWKQINDTKELRDTIASLRGDITDLEVLISGNSEDPEDTGLVGQVESNASAISDLSGRLDTDEEVIEENTREIETLKAILGTVDPDSSLGLAQQVATNTVNIGINTGKIAENTEAIGLNSEAIAENASAISGLDGRVTTLEDDVLDLKTTIGDENSGLIKDIANNRTNIGNLQQAIGDESSGLIKDIKDNKTVIGVNTEKISEHETAISNLNTKIDDEIEEVQNNISEALRTADAMSFKGVLSETTKDSNEITYLSLPTTEVSAGDTYKVSINGAIINGDNLLSGESVTARIGDLVIANADQGEEDEVYIGKWYHISSGYEDDYAAYLAGDANNNTVELKGGAGEDRGSIIFTTNHRNLEIGIDSEPIGNNKTPEKCTVTFNLVWDTF